MSGGIKRKMCEDIFSQCDYAVKKKPSVFNYVPIIFRLTIIEFKANSQCCICLEGKETFRFMYCKGDHEGFCKECFDSKEFDHCPKCRASDDNFVVV